jgi:hypothetical protein
MSYSSPKASLLSILSGPPQTFNKRSVLLSTLFLTALLIAVVPIVTVSTGIPTLALVAVAGLLYAAVLLFTDTIFEGLCGAVFVLVTFAANVPLITLPMGGGGYTAPQLELLLVDIVAIPFVGLICWWLYSGKISLSFGRERIAGYALAGFVGWSLFAALVANGPSRLAALFYVVVQLRYLILFGIGAVVVRYIGIHTTVYSLSIAIFGQSAYAIFEVISRDPFSLTRLGDGTGGLASVFSVGPLLFKTSLSAGGFAGNSRVLITLLLLVVPVLIAIIIRRSTPWKLIAAVALIGSIFLVRVSKTDSGFIAFLFTIFLTVVALFGIWLLTDTANRTVRYGASDYVFGFGSAIGSIALCVFLFSQRAVQNVSSNTENPANTGSSAGGGSSTGGASSAGASPGGGSDLLIQAINSIPFVSTANISVRLQQYVAALNIGIHYPLFGIGGMNFPLVAESYGLPRPIAIHNVYLSVLASTGIPGAILFLVSISAVLVVAGRMALSPETDRLFWAMLVCGMLGFHAYNFWVTRSGGVTYLVFWVLAGAVVGARRHKQQTGETSRLNALVT